MVDTRNFQVLGGISLAILCQIGNLTPKQYHKQFKLDSTLQLLIKKIKVSVNNNSLGNPENLCYAGQEREKEI